MSGLDKITVYSAYGYSVNIVVPDCSAIYPMFLDNPSQKLVLQMAEGVGI